MPWCRASPPKVVRTPILEANSNVGDWESLAHFSRVGVTNIQSSGCDQRWRDKDWEQGKELQWKHIGGSNAHKAHTERLFFDGDCREAAEHTAAERSGIVQSPAAALQCTKRGRTAL